jgi:hypothetical protein
MIPPFVVDSPSGIPITGLCPNAVPPEWRWRSRSVAYFGNYTVADANPVAAGENIDRREQARIMFGTLAEPWNLRCPQLINSLDSC